MPSFSLNGKLRKAAASHSVVPKYITRQLHTELLIWLNYMEGVTVSEGAKAPGAVRNQFSGLLPGVQKKKQHPPPKKNKPKVLSKWKAGFQGDPVLIVACFFPWSSFSAGNVV